MNRIPVPRGPFQKGRLERVDLVALVTRAFRKEDDAGAVLDRGVDLVEDPDRVPLPVPVDEDDPGHPREVAQYGPGRDLMLGDECRPELGAEYEDVEVTEVIRHHEERLGWRGADHVDP